MGTKHVKTVHDAVCHPHKVTLPHEQLHGGLQQNCTRQVPKGGVQPQGLGWSIVKSEHHFTGRKCCCCDREALHRWRRWGRCALGRWNAACAQRRWATKIAAARPCLSC